MPFKSQAQMRWMFANKPEMAQKWARHTPNVRRLPQRLTENAALKKALRKERAS